MKENRKLSEAIFELWRSLTRRRRRQLVLVVLIMVAASIAEVFSLGMIVPFLALLTAPDKVMANPLAHALLAGLPGASAQGLVIWATAAFCFAAIASAAVRILLLYVSTRYSRALGADLSLQIYRRTLYQPYRVHISRNSSEIINGVTHKTNVLISNVLQPLLTVASSVLILIGILGALFAISWSITLSALLVLGIIYAVIMQVTRARMQQDSRVVADESTQVVKALQEGLGGIRDVLIDGTQETFSTIYEVSDRRMRAAQARAILSSGSPRFAIEGLGMVFIALLAVGMSRGGADPGVVPVLGALALGSQRLLPIAQQAYAAVSLVRASEASFVDVLDLLRQPMPELASAGRAEPLPFHTALELRHVHFSYAPGGEAVLKDLSLVIPRGSRLGIFGPTGGGKSTLLDVLMGLLEPTEGSVLVDGVKVDASTQPGWRRHIAHVPQSIYLSDASIAENIAFGVPAGKVDLDRVREAARMAQIGAVIDTWPEGYRTVVGERGVRLSGGQRQRIGIARALYKQADFIVLDEATSALDNDTERELMQAIDALSRDLTLVMVAHRLTTLQHCDLLVEVVGGRVVRTGSYAELVLGERRSGASAPLGQAGGP